MHIAGVLRLASRGICSTRSNGAVQSSIDTAAVNPACE